MAALLKWLDISLDAFAQPVVLAILGYTYYLVLAGTSYAVLFVWQRARFHPESLVYWIHRALHTDLLYRRVHAAHHRFRVATPFVGVAFNPLDSFAQALPMHLCLFLFPVHIGVYTVCIGLITAWAVSIHDRVSVTSCPAINYTGHHTLHHWYYDCNFGQFFTLWDRIAGTHRDPECSPEVPPAVLRPNLSRRRRVRPAVEEGGRSCP